MAGRAYLKDIPYWATCWKLAFQTNVTSQALVACNLHDRKAETALPPTKQYRLSSKLFVTMIDIKKKRAEDSRIVRNAFGVVWLVQTLGSEAGRTCVDQKTCLPESILSRGGEGAIVALVFLQICKFALVLFVQ